MIYLCPNDVLIGRATSEMPQGPFKPTRNPRDRVELSKNWSFVLETMDSGCVSDASHTKEMACERRNLKVGDVEMNVEENAVRGKWTLGRVIEVYPGQDGLIRNVKLKTSVGEYTLDR